MVLASQAGQPQALENLARRWTPKLLRYAARMTGSAELAKDVVQDTWTGAIRALKALDDPARFPAWIYGIAHRKCADCVRRLSRRRRLSSALEAQSVLEPHETIGKDESVDMQRALARLSKQHREVISLFYGEDLDVDEIATVLNIPDGTVKSRLFNARRLLREHLGD